MYLLTAALLPVAALAGVSSGRTIDRNRIEVSLLDMGAIFSHHRPTVEASKSKRHYRASSDGSRGDSLIHNDLVQILKAEAGEFPPPAITRDDEWFPIETTYLKSTSHHHVDRRLIYGSGAGCKNPIADDMVGFVALETNEDAYFDHPKMSVPIRAGTFIRFMGNTAHRTIINKGKVHLLGPIDIKTFIGVEDTCTDDNPNECGTCGEAFSPDSCLANDCIPCSTEGEVESPPASGIFVPACIAGCVYQKTNGNGDTTCMCISCASTCGLDLEAGNKQLKGNNPLPATDGDSDDFPDECDSPANDFEQYPCIVRNACKFNSDCNIAPRDFCSGTLGQCVECRFDTDCDDLDAATTDSCLEDYTCQNIV